MAKIYRKNAIVTFGNGTDYAPGQWRIVSREAGLAGYDCDRYTLRNEKTGYEVSGVRDKDIEPKSSKYFAGFIAESQTAKADAWRAKRAAVQGNF